MKALNTKRAIKMANKATDSNLRGVSSADSDEDDVWVEVQVANHVGPHPNIVGMQEVIRDEETEWLYRKMLDLANQADAESGWDLLSNSGSLHPGFGG